MKAASPACPAVPAPHRPKPRERLAAALAAGRVDAARVAGILRVAPADVPALAEGRVRLPGATWRRLLREVGAA